MLQDVTCGIHPIPNCILKLNETYTSNLHFKLLTWNPKLHFKFDFRFAFQAALPIRISHWHLTLSSLVSPKTEATRMVLNDSARSVCLQGPNFEKVTDSKIGKSRIIGFKIHQCCRMSHAASIRVRTAF